MGIGCTEMFKNPSALTSHKSAREWRFQAGQGRGNGKYLCYAGFGDFRVQVCTSIRQEQRIFFAKDHTFCRWLGEAVLNLFTVQISRLCMQKYFASGS